MIHDGTEISLGRQELLDLLYRDAREIAKPIFGKQWIGVFREYLNVAFNQCLQLRLFDYEHDRVPTICGLIPRMTGR